MYNRDQVVLSLHEGELQAAVERLAKHMDVANFTARSGWLWCFRRMYNISNQEACGEAFNADVESVEPFRMKLNDIINELGLYLSQLYNADETGIFWRSLPENTRHLNMTLQHLEES
jgi:hypothetical protein